MEWPIEGVSGMSLLLNVKQPRWKHDVNSQQGDGNHVWNDNLIQYGISFYQIKSPGCSTIKRDILERGR